MPEESPAAIDRTCTAIGGPAATDASLPEHESEPEPSPPTPAAPIEQAPAQGWDLARLLNRPVPPRDRPYRDLAANILSQLEPGQPAAILFVAPAGSRRRTANLTRLATVLAGEVRGGVLAMDVDLALPGLAEAFGFDAERGVADVLLGAANWRDLVLPTGTEGLFVLPGRPFPAARSPALPPLPLARLLDDLRRHYGLVLLDAGQSLPEKVASWARFCEGAYLLAGLGETTARAASQAADLVDQAAGRVLGTVLIQNAES
jgi:Mrp family chromosome partitioning ATPase